MRRLAVLFSALLLSVAAVAQAVPANEAHPFLRWSRDPGISGMAGTGLTSMQVSPAFAVFSNPAAIAMMDGLGSVKASYSLYAPSFTKTSNIAVGAAFRPVKRFGFAVGYVHQLGYEKIDEFAPYDFAVGGALSVGIGEHVALGVNAKYSKACFMKDFSSSAFSVDILAQVRFWEGFNAAVGVRSVGKILEDSDMSSLPSSLAVGLSYRYVTGIHSIEALLDGDWFFSNNWGVSAGFSYGIKEIGFVRVGYRFASESAAVPSHLAVGLGLKYIGLSLDVSYITLNKVIGNTFQIGLGYSF
ncbi:MAG: hypothetical protein J6T02_05140 [Bacteroidales bacterium]|nr:hypothetical protein [Bacteroidales bacterium]